LRLIADGFLDQERGNVETLASRLGMGARQLRRLFEQHLGLSPIAVAQTRRLLFAKQLLHDTDLSMAEVAMAGGFGSIRRFNDAFRTLYGLSPAALRRRIRHVEQAATGVPFTVHIPYRPPYDWGAMLTYLRARAIDGMELVEGGVYRRTFAETGTQGTVAVAPVPNRNRLLATMESPSLPSLQAIVNKLRRLFDVNADMETITAHLANDRSMAGLVASRPGLRTPGCWDGFELAVRAVLGQQITVEGARRLASKLVGIYGELIPNAADARLSRVFPSAASLAQADLTPLGIPVSRRATIKALALAAVANPQMFMPAGSIDDSVAQLRTVPGIGEWTAQYIALRALQEPDAFPATDAAILRGASRLDGVSRTASQLIQRAEVWRPWRAYAAQYLWTAESHPPMPRER
jgi:AraC family transcriptional regulator of adaptative response / DNA-3-methyladenine glycosylase II